MPSQRLIVLDAFRGVAILLVLFHHPFVPAMWSGEASPFAEVAYRFGWTGVDFFFVLSGFLVGGLLMGELRNRGGIDVRRFLVRRTFKIWPSYFALIALVFVLTATIDPPRDPAKAFRHILPNLFHVQNYWISPRLQTWSLAVEEHFYLLLPAVLALVSRTREPGRWVVGIALSLMAGCLGLRLWTLAAGANASMAFVFPTQHRLDSLFFGVLLAYFYRFHAGRLRALAPWRGLLAVTGIAFVSPMLVIDLNFSPFVVTYGLSLLYLGYGLLLVAALLPTIERGGAEPKRGVLTRGLAGVGRVSYPMYLVFVDTQQLLVRLGLTAFAPASLTVWVGDAGRAQGLWWVLTQLAFIGVTVAAGYLVTATVERPGLALRDRLFPSRASAL